MSNYYYGKEDGKPLVKIAVMKSGREYWHIMKRGQWLVTFKRPSLDGLKEVIPF